MDTMDILLRIMMVVMIVFTYYNAMLLFKETDDE